VRLVLTWPDLTVVVDLTAKISLETCTTLRLLRGFIFLHIPCVTFLDLVCVAPTV
jgi:hypothetical protein